MSSGGGGVAGVRWGGVCREGGELRRWWGVGCGGVRSEGDRLGNLIGFCDSGGS